MLMPCPQLWHVATRCVKTQTQNGVKQELTAIPQSTWCLIILFIVTAQLIFGFKQINSAVQVGTRPKQKLHRPLVILMTQMSYDCRNCLECDLTSIHCKNSDMNRIIRQQLRNYFLGSAVFIQSRLPVYKHSIFIRKENAKFFITFLYLRIVFRINRATFNLQQCECYVCISEQHNHVFFACSYLY